MVSELLSVAIFCMLRYIVLYSYMTLVYFVYSILYDHYKSLTKNVHSWSVNCSALLLWCNFITANTLPNSLSPQAYCRSHKLLSKWVSKTVGWGQYQNRDSWSYSCTGKRNVLAALGKKYLTKIEGTLKFTEAANQILLCIIVCLEDIM